MKKTLLLGTVLILAVALAGCGGTSTPFASGPGLVGIDDTGVNTAPLLRVTFTVPPSTVQTTVEILSDSASDGDIAFDAVLNAFTVTTGTAEVLFGFDSFDANLTEFRGFLTFPLDGATGQPIVPGTAVIVLAELEIFVDRVSFASVVPTFLDLVQYPFRGLTAVDFNTAPLAFRTLDFFSSDFGRLVQIDVTPFMQEAQIPPALTDLQVRFLVDSTGVLSSTRAPAAEAGRAVQSHPRVLDNMSPNRGPSASQPVTTPDQASRKR